MTCHCLRQFISFITFTTLRKKKNVSLFSFMAPPSFRYGLLLNNWLHRVTVSIATGSCSRLLVSVSSYSVVALLPFAMVINCPRPRGLLLLVLSLLVATPACDAFWLWNQTVSGVQIYDPFYLALTERIAPTLLKYSPKAVRIWLQGVIPLELATYSSGGLKIYVISDDKNQFKLFRQLIQKRVFRWITIIFFIK